MDTQVKEAYAKAATETITLCSTNAYAGIDLSWVPDEVLRTNQGCASPLADAKNDVDRGSVVLDLGCGAGLDVFLASKQVGQAGHVYGVDMTPEMLKIARESQDKVAESLGYSKSNVSFHEGTMENLPIESDVVDTVISNCVVNLSDDKSKVFSEILRVLRPGGKFVISDVLTMDELPLYIQNDQKMINLCLGGAMSISSFLGVLRESGFQGVTLFSQKSYSQVDGYDFLSLTITAFKPVAADDTAPQFATLIGPCSVVVDELGNRFERGVATEVTPETAKMLQFPRYRSYFFVTPEPREMAGAAQLGIPPEPGACIYAGDFVNLVGPFTEVRDDDNHVFKAGEETEICGKTVKVLSSPLYKQLFVMINRSQGDLEANQVDCSPGGGCC